jgi:hypothetical protein
MGHINTAYEKGVYSFTELIWKAVNWSNKTYLLLEKNLYFLIQSRKWKAFEGFHIYTLK